MFPDAAEGLHIGGRIHGGDITGKEFDPVRCRRRHQIHYRVLVIIALVLIPGNAGGHGPVLHVMSVNDGIVIGKVGPVLDIQEWTAVAVLRPVCQVLQLIGIVIALYNRVIDGGIRSVDPADHIGIYFLQCPEIDLRQVLWF